MLYQSLIATPLGKLRVLADERVLHRVLFEEQKGKYAHLNSIPGTSAPIACFEQELQSYFAGNLKEFTTPYVLQGTFFQVTVWQEVGKIPWGKTLVYSEVAEEIQRPLAVRAAASAVGDNPLAILIPCHRVVRKQALGGYAGGVWRKKWLLDHETASRKNLK